MWKFANKFRERKRQSGGFVFSRPLVLLQSDDWGRVGLRDHEGLESLRASGIELGENPYDFYTLETSEDLGAMQEMLRRHRDSVGRSPCIVANFVLANLDFARMAAEKFQRIHLIALSQGLPANWSRPGLMEAYLEAVAEGTIYPALHGVTHFCRTAMEGALAQGEGHAALLRKLWQAGTPYIYWRMPWIGYEYCRPENPGEGFLGADSQAKLIEDAVEIFSAVFSRPPLSACAPGYRANCDTRSAWARRGVRVAQNGPGAFVRPFIDDRGLLMLSRSLDFEPAHAEPSLKECMKIAKESFSRGAPLIISVHSLNFHSTVKNFRDPTLRALDGFLSALETAFPDLLYVHDADVHNMVEHGSFGMAQESVSVNVRRENSV